MLRYRDSDSLYVGMQEAALCALRSQVLHSAAGQRPRVGWAGDRRRPRSSCLLMRGQTGRACHTQGRTQAHHFYPTLQLLMALHDLKETELCSREPCHKMAWTLDACVKVG